MNKILTLALAAFVFAPSFAQETVEQAASTKDKEAAWWPIPFAICEWPETPDMVGLRLSIPFSSKQENVTGIDLGFWGVSKDFEGLGVSILRNNVKDTLAGIQLGLYNTANRADLGALQVGLWNETQSVRGLQVGLVNVTGDAEGFQVGLINRAETLNGFQFGVINVIRDAELPFCLLLNVGW